MTNQPMPYNNNYYFENFTHRSIAATLPALLNEAYLKGKDDGKCAHAHTRARTHTQLTARHRASRKSAQASRRAWVDAAYTIAAEDEAYINAPLAEHQPAHDAEMTFRRIRSQQTKHISELVTAHVTFVETHEQAIKVAEEARALFAFSLTLPKCQQHVTPTADEDGSVSSRKRPRSPRPQQAGPHRQDLNSSDSES